MSNRSAITTAAFLFFVTVPAAAQSYYSDNLQDSRIGFGRSVAVAEGEVFVGESETFYSSGLIHVFTKTGNTWIEAYSIQPENALPANGFGFQIALAENTLIASAIDPGLRSGSGAYVFERTDRSEEWSQRAHLLGDDLEEGDGFGVSVAVGNGYAIVGASKQNEGTGAAYVFKKGDDGNWTQIQKLVLEDGEAEDRFGSVVTLDGTHALISAARRNGGIGAVYHYTLNGETGQWVLSGQVEANGLDENARFGSAILLSGRHAAIGAPGNNSGTGTVVIYVRDDSGEWDNTGRLVPFDQLPRASFGSAIAATDRALWVGAAGASNRQGRAYRFTWNPDRSWADVDKLAPSGIANGDRFATRLAAYGDLVAATSPGDDYGAGTAVIYETDDDGHWYLANRVDSELEALPGVAGGQINCESNVAADFGCHAIDMVALLPVAEMGGTRGVKLNDVWGWTDSTTGRDYAIVGLHDRTSFVDVTDAFNPRYLGNLPMTEGANGAVWRDIKVYRNHAFIVADGAGQHGMQVFDLTRLRNVDGEPGEFTEDAHYDRIASTHNIAINEQTGFAYAVGARGGGETCGGGLHMIDIREPTNPTFAGCFADSETGRRGTGYSHDAQCIVYNGPDEDYLGREICFGLNETALSIADVTDKEAPVAISRATYPNVGYAHQGWITDDHRYFFSDDELDEIAGTVDNTRTLVWDIADLDDPVLVKEYFATTSSTDHNLYIRGNRMYQSNNTAGLRIVDISDPTNPVEVGYFDTFPSGDDVPGFHGTWSNYPYFESGVILATGRREGLFILKERKDLVP